MVIYMVNQKKKQRETTIIVVFVLASSLTSTVSRDNSGIAYGKEIERENIQTKNKVREREREREKQKSIKLIMAFTVPSRHISQA